MKRTISAALCILMAMAVIGCTANKPTPDTQERTVSVTATVTEDTKYHAAILSVSPDEFEAAGFRLGDSCDITFENGHAITDVPFYNGYYVKNEAPVIVAYPGFDDIRITYNNLGIWDTANLTEGETVTVRLAQAQKYADVQEVLGQQYSFERSDYDSDDQFCNFRALTGGNLRENTFYRGASPVDNSRGRAAYTDALLRAKGIQFVLDLADSQEDLDGYFAADDFSSYYTQSLMENGMVLLANVSAVPLLSSGVALMDMSSAFQSDIYRQKVAEGMRQMMAEDGPYYIHCMEGKDRTGFVCMVVEALAGASYGEMRADYMITYRNYFGVTEEKTPEKYKAIAALYFDAFAEFLLGTDDKDAMKTADYTDCAADYLMSGGMTQEEVKQLQAFLTGTSK